ncbi:hypothetical protein N2152v2_002436 [Parachlorella kessleri]
MSLRDNRDKPYVRPPLNRQGPGLVTLGAPKENAGNDPTTQLVPSGQSGWTAAKPEESPERHSAGGASLVERSTWASGEGPRVPPLPQAAWQRAGPLNPQDFPSLAASASGKPPLPHQHPRPPSDLVVQAGIWDEDERDYRHPVQRSALIDRGEPRDSSRDHPGYGSGSSYREDRERGPHASRGDSGRHSPTDLGYGYDRGQHNREGAPGYSAREGTYSRDRSEPPPYRDWDASHSGREGPHHSEEGRSSREHYPPRDRHGPGYGYGGPREPRYDNGGRWGGYESRRYDDEGYREEYGRGYGGGGFDSRQPNPRFERPSRPYQPAADYDPELFPPMPGEPPPRGGPSGNRGVRLDRDEDREAFNAELERVAAELDRRQQHQQQQSGNGEGSGSALVHKRRGSDQLERGYSSGEEHEHPTRASAWGDAQGSVAARAAAERRAAEEEESERREAAARKLREIENRMAERDEEAQRRARELADAQAAAHAALSKPPPPGAEPAFERRPSGASLDRRLEPPSRPSPQGPAALPAAPPPPPPPRPSRAEGQHQQPAAHTAADAPVVEARRPAAPPAVLPVSSPPPPPPVQAHVRQLSPPAPPQAEVQQVVAPQPAFQPPAPEATASPMGSPARQPSPQQEQHHEQAPVSDASAAEPSPAAANQPAAAPILSPHNGTAPQDDLAALPPQAQPAVTPAMSPAQAAGAAASMTSLVKPGASWRAMLTGVPDVPPKAALTGGAEQAAPQRAAGAASGREGKGGGREREGKRAKAKGGKAAPAAGPLVAAAPSVTAEAGPAPAKGKAKGRGGKAQKVAVVTALSGELQQQQPQHHPGQAQQAQQPRGNRRQQQQQVQRGEGPAAAGGKSGKGAGRGRGRGKAGAAPPGQPAEQAFEHSPAVFGSPASSLLPTAQQERQQPAAAAQAAALPQLMAAGEGAGAATVGSGELLESSELPLAPALSAAAFGWSSPLADEVAKLQLSAAASAEAELAVEVAGAATSASHVADMARESLPAAMMLEVGLDQELLEPSARVMAGAMPPATALEPLPAATAALGNAAGAQAEPALSAAAMVGTSSGLDLLGDDVITALPADLSLDLAGGTVASPAVEPGVPPHSAFVLPPQPQHAVSPPPFPASYFPITSLPGEPSATSLAAAAQSLYSIAQHGGPHFTFGTHTNIPIHGASLDVNQFSQQQQQQHPQHPHHHFQQHQPGQGAFGLQGQEAGMPFGQPSSFLGPPAAFVPTGKQPDWSTPQGRTSSPAPLPTYPPVQQSLPLPTQNGEAVVQYALGVSAGAYGRVPSPAPPASLQYGHQHPQQQQQLLQQGASGLRQPHAFAPPQQPQQQYFDPAAALPDDVFGEGTSQAPSTNSGSGHGHGGMGPMAPGGMLNGPAGSGAVPRRGPRQHEGGPAGNRGPARGPRYDGGTGGMGPLHQPHHMGPPPPLPPHHQQQQQLYLMMNGFPGRGPLPYGGRGGPLPPMPPRHQQHMMGGGLGLRGGPGAMPPPPPDPAGGGARGGRARAGRAGRSGRGISGGGGSGGPQPVKNMYVAKQQPAPHAPALEA